MMVQVFSVLLVIVSGILCSGAQQGVSSTQAGQTLQIQPNVRKYNKHTATEKPCTTAGSTTGTRKDKPDSSDSQDYVPIGGGGQSGPGYPTYPPYPYPTYPPYPYPTYPPYSYPQPVGGPVLAPAGGYPYRIQYPYEPQYPVEPAPYYAPYNPALPQSYHPIAYPAPQSPYEQATVVDAYRSPLTPQYLQHQQFATEQTQFFRQPIAASATPIPSPHYFNNPPPHFGRAQAYGRPTAVTPSSAFLQQRDATAGTTVEPSQYEQQQQSGTFDSGNQFHY